MTIAATFGDLNRVYTDANGLPLAAGSLSFYAAGTTTPQDTFKQADLDPSSVNTNPVVLNASGYADDPIYLSATGYKVNLKDADGVQQSGWPRDDYGVAAPEF